MQIDILHYGGELQVGDKIDDASVIDVYDAKAGKVDALQMREVKRFFGKDAKLVQPPAKWTPQGGGLSRMFKND